MAQTETKLLYKLFEPLIEIETNLVYTVAEINATTKVYRLVRDEATQIILDEESIMIRFKSFPKIIKTKEHFI